MLGVPWLFFGKGILKLWSRRLRREWKKRALSLVAEAAVLFSDKAERRRFVRGKVMTQFGLTEGQARRLVEWSVNRWKSEG